MDTGLKDFRLVLWNVPSEKIPSNPLDMRYLDIDQASDPGLVEALNDGWQIVSHTITPMQGGGVLLSLFMQRDIRVPDSL
ncbi:MAG: hypothetical protein LKI34_03010 [Bifidobacterium tibiigranuli]|jgi:hypothetical protein|uniref:hypothetical protein n=1 Tax=Bifidobacterium tibiigranuli TaxID=2172043 RepID=UPI0026F32171|nr:hypothetical protein [Bifidobacterium tibiigranuli]MCI1673177.1 hypothetical protein [Bifidobacterium tibiigranuli]MCI1713578.1 hypothetical protein [Bifidobacterium tibiigranuli]